MRFKRRKMNYQNYMKKIHQCFRIIKMLIKLNKNEFVKAKLKKKNKKKLKNY